jgi:hypothetical protein
MLTHNGWLCLRDESHASPVQVFVLDYALSKWLDEGGEAKSKLKRDIAAVSIQQTDLDEQRQTNSFQGKMWR